MVIEWIFFYSLKKRATPNNYLNLTILWATRFIREKIMRIFEMFQIYLFETNKINSLIGAFCEFIYFFFDTTIVLYFR